MLSTLKVTELKMNMLEYDARLFEKEILDFNMAPGCYRKVVHLFNNEKTVRFTGKLPALVRCKKSFHTYIIWDFQLVTFNRYVLCPKCM